MLAPKSLASLPRLADSSHSGQTKQEKQRKKLILGAWNIRTLLDRADTSRPERRTALLAKELQRNRIDIAALSETRLSDEGSLKEKSGRYTFFWKGKLQTEDRIHGVGFTIRTASTKHLPVLPVEINERFMKLHVPIGKSRHLTIICAYAPTLTSPVDIKGKFYDNLDHAIEITPQSDKLVLRGDFNARVGRDHSS